MHHLQERYNKEIVPALRKEFSFSNVMEVPKVTKVVVNIGVGSETLTDNKAVDAAVNDLTTIVGQKPVVTKARKSISNFKLREGKAIGVKVTLRGERMWSFLDRLMNLAIPRIKDFRGVSDRSFDKGGSWSFGLTEQAVWPEINMANVNFSHGMNITIVFSNSDPKKSRFALAELGMPFEKPEDRRKK